MLSKRHFAPLIAVVIVLLVGLLGEFGFKLEKMRILNDQRSKVAVEVGQFRSILESQLNATLYITDGLVAYVKSHPQPEPLLVQSMLKTLYEQSRHIRNIGLAPGNRITYIYPVKGNERAVGLYYPDLSDQWPAVRRTIEERMPILAGPVELKQGGVGLIYRVPVFIGSGNEYWGLLSMVIDHERLFSESGIAAQTSGLQLALRGKNGTGALGDAFMGDASLFSVDSIKATINLPGGTWQLAAKPIEGWSTGQQIYWLRVACWVAGLILGTLVFFTLLTFAKRLRAEQTLKRSRDDLNEAQRIAMIGSWVLDLRSKKLTWSDETFRIFEVNPKKYAASYDAFLNAIHPEDREAVDRAYNDSLVNHQPYDTVHRLVLSDGRIKYVRERCETEYDEGGTPILSRGTVQDITQVKQVENALKESEERWKFALEGAGHGVWDWDIQTGEMFLSKQEMTVLGYDGDSAIHTHADVWTNKLHPEDIDTRNRALEQYFSGEAPIYICEYRTRGRDNHWIWILARGMLVNRTADGMPLRMIGTHTDITEQKNTENELKRLANTDPLTGVMNRRYIIEAIENELIRINRSGRPAALLMMDVDYFKNVNDKLGHAAGDAVLKHITELCLGCLRCTDRFGRLGGEEFAFLLPETDIHGAWKFASRLRQLIAKTPFCSSTGEIFVTVSVGIALSENDESDPKDLMGRADMALYRAKGEGRNRVEFAEVGLANRVSSRASK